MDDEDRTPSMLADPALPSVSMNDDGDRPVAARRLGDWPWLVKLGFLCSRLVLGVCRGGVDRFVSGPDQSDSVQVASSAMRGLGCCSLDRLSLRERTGRPLSGACVLDAAPGGALMISSTAGALRWRSRDTLRFLLFSRCMPICRSRAATAAVFNSGMMGPGFGVRRASCGAFSSPASASSPWAPSPSASSDCDFLGLRVLAFFFFSGTASGLRHCPSAAPAARNRVESRHSVFTLVCTGTTATSFEGGSPSRCIRETSDLSAVVQTAGTTRALVLFTSTGPASCSAM
mmetsp:Transcript_18303/g.43029  ORF Transcript_18303/g.43029 Transcript_18303/m.43029 type:complete len:288 (+) Transcript_18303:371-1234(+)